MKFALQCLSVFLIAVLIDYAYTRYNITSTTKQAHAAARWSVLIYACAAINVLSYTTNHWLLIPALCGAYLGTWVAVKRES